MGKLSNYMANHPLSIISFALGLMGLPCCFRGTDLVALVEDVPVVEPPECPISGDDIG